MTEEDRIQSIDSLAERVDRQESMLDEILGMLKGGGHRAAPRAGEAGGDEGTTGGRPSSVAEQVRAELARAKEEERRQADADAVKSETQQLRERLAKLEETKPEAPQPRRQRIMWGSR